MVDILQSKNRIAEAFKNKTLFITGGTGFLGKVFIEKTLRTCPTIAKIYLIVRARKEKDPQTRIREMFKNPLFELLKRTSGKEIFEKVIAIPGDVSEQNLGLMDKHRKLIVENVEIIYHMAASTRFDEPLKNAISTNTISTREVIKLAKECKKLLVFVHVSTAYCFPQQRTLYEKVYSLPVNPNDVINLVQTMDDDTIETIGKKYMNEYPNTYSFSKALAEILVSDEMGNLPLIIARPSIVIPVLQDPIPGWTDNMNGIIGLAVATGKGILRFAYCKPTAYADFIPVDMTANKLLAVTYDYMTNRSRRIYNLTSSSEVKVTWYKISELFKNAAIRVPYNWTIWYPGASMKRYRFVHIICVILFQYIPAIILDLLCVLSANKPIYWKIQQKLTKFFDVYEYYLNNQWYFNNDNVLEVRKLMNEAEKEIYKVDSGGVDIENYMCDCVHFIRLHLLKQTDETLPAARRRMKMLWILHKFFGILIWIVISYFITQCFIKIIKCE